MVDTVPEIEVDVEAPAEKPMPAARSSLLSRTFRKGRFRLVIKAVIALVLLPYALILLYLAPFIHPVSTLMLADLALLKGYDRRWVPFEEIAPVLVQSVMMSEDGQVCAHNGVDWTQMR